MGVEWSQPVSTPWPRPRPSHAARVPQIAEDKQPGAPFDIAPVSVYPYCVQRQLPTHSLHPTINLGNVRVNPRGNVRAAVCLAVVLSIAVVSSSLAGGLASLGTVQANTSATALPGFHLTIARYALWSGVPSFPLSWSEWALGAIEAPAPTHNTTVTRIRPPRTEGGPVEVGGNHLDRYEYRDTFAEGWHREDATIEGGDRVHWDRSASTLEIRGAQEPRRVSLCYHFVSSYVVKDIQSTLEGDIQGGPSDRVEVTLSPDGKTFGHAVGAFGRTTPNAFCLTTNGSRKFHTYGFWVRITADLAPTSRVRLTCFRTKSRIKPPLRPEVALSPAGDDRLRYRDDFRSTKLMHLAEISNQPALEWRRGRIYIRGRKDTPVRVAVRQRFLSPEPLRAIAVRIHNSANLRGAGGRNQFAISLDGRTPIALQATPGPKGVFTGVTELRLEDPTRLAKAREFYLHMTLANEAGKPTDSSNSISCVEVEARTAQPPAKTTASLR